MLRALTPSHQFKTQCQSAIIFTTLAVSTFELSVAPLCVAEEVSQRLDTEEATDVLTRLTEMWEAQDSAISSAKITYRHLHRSSGSLMPLSPEEFSRVVAEYNLASTPNDLSDLVKRVLTKLPTSKHPYAVKTFSISGWNTRETSVEDGITKTDRAFDGETDVYLDHTHSQADIHQAGLSVIHRTHLREFRVIPLADAMREQEASFVVDRLPNAQIAISNGGYDVLCDATTGFVWREAIMRSSGVVRILRFQQGLQTYPGDIIFPAVLISAQFGPSEPHPLKVLDVRIIETAEFNRELPAETFVAQADAGTNVFDYRSNPNDAEHVAVLRDTDNLVQYVADAKLAPAPRPSHQIAGEL